MKKEEHKSKVMKKSKKTLLILSIAIYAIFVVVSMMLEYEPGKIIGSNFSLFATDMIKLFPPAFVLVGLFMVWVDRKTIEKYFGEASGFMGFVTAILLACTTLYPFVVVLPMAAALSKKGARLGIVLTYLGATAICRIPMTIFEASFLGLRFSLIRYIVSIPLILLSSLLIEKMLGKDYFQENDLEKALEV